MGYIMAQAERTIRGWPHYWFIGLRKSITQPMSRSVHCILGKLTLERRMKPYRNLIFGDFQIE